MSRAPRTRRAPRRRTALAFAGLVGFASLGLVGCSSDEAARPPSISPIPDDGTIVEEGVHNAQDAAFATDMIIHHHQALTMAGMVPGRTQNEKLLALAQRIQAAQAPEIREMSRWLVEWGKPVPSPSADPSGHSLIGMASPAELKRLEAATGATFDRTFLTLMITHHKGAVTQARDQLRAGADQRAKGLAQDVVTAQSAEILDMRTLLG